MNNDNSLFGEAIFSYSRAQAIEDGVLVDLTDYEVVREHWKLPLACTESIWNILEDARKEHGKDICGMLHDISTVAKLTIRRAKVGDDEIAFEAIVGKSKQVFKLHCGPGDNGAPVLTLMLPSED